MDRYNRASARSVEKERRETKRKLQLQQENSNLQAAEALVDLSNLPSPSDMVEENDKENSGMCIAVLMIFSFMSMSNQ